MLVSESNLQQMAMMTAVGQHARANDLYDLPDAQRAGRDTGGVLYAPTAKADMAFTRSCQPSLQQ